MTNSTTGPAPKIGQDVDHLRILALRMGALADAILDKALRAAWARDTTLTAEVIEDDLEIDRLDVEIDEAVLHTLALRAPVASDLRLVLAVKTMATDLERIGDLARNIAGCVDRLAERPPVEPPAILRQLATDSQRVLRRAIQAFADLDAEQARVVIASDDEIDSAEDQVIRDAIAQIHATPTASGQGVDLIFIAQSLERVGDHATNIAEDVILAVESSNVKHLEKLSD